MMENSPGSVENEQKAFCVYIQGNGDEFKIYLTALIDGSLLLPCLY